MLLITETVDEVEYLEEADSSGKKSMYISGPFLAFNVGNKNGRIYPEAVMDTEVARYIKEAIETKSAFGELNHPNSPALNLERVSHITTELKKSGNHYMGKARLCETPMGNIARGIIEADGRLGVSSRALGSLVKKGGLMEVQSDFRLATCADIVSNPSGPSCFVNGIMENLNWFYDEKMGWQSLEITESIKQEVHKNYKKLNESDFLIMFNQYVKAL
jgi:hypothetical protein